MEFGVHLKGKETHLFFSQRIEHFENPVKYALARYNLSKFWEMHSQKP